MSFLPSLTRLAAFSAALLSLFALAQPAGAKSCGGAVTCDCGDTVIESTTLSQDLGVCTETGLRIVGTGVVLDCAGHAITGNDQSNAKFGIHLDGTTNAEVRNCHVTLFRRGLRINGGSGNHLVGNESFLNKYGIDVAGATTGNSLVGNLVRDNRDEGVHFGTDSDGNRIIGNELRYNKHENLYFLHSDGNLIKNNLIHHSNSSAIFVKHSKNNRFIRNEVRDTALQVRGDSTGNFFKLNYLKGDGYVFDAYEEPTGWTYPHDNHSRRDCIRKTDFCYRFIGAYDNHASGARTDGRCDPPDTNEVGGGQMAFDNTVALTAQSCTGRPW